jgi:hypothetical protein
VPWTMVDPDSILTLTGVVRLEVLPFPLELAV